MDVCQGERSTQNSGLGEEGHFPEVLVFSAQYRNGKDDITEREGAEGKNYCILSCRLLPWPGLNGSPGQITKIP